MKWAELAGLGCLRNEEKIIRIETEPQIFVKSKNGFSKHCLVSNFASYVKLRELDLKKLTHPNNIQRERGISVISQQREEEVWKS